MWTASALHKAGLREEPCCRKCGAPYEDKFHFFWECPHSEGIRGASAFSKWQIDPAALPPALALHAIAPAMDVEPTATYWGVQWSAAPVRGQVHPGSEWQHTNLPHLYS